MIDLVFKNSTSNKNISQDLFKNIIRRTIKVLKITKSLELSINLVGEARIRELNKKHRRKNKITDVLSFPIENKPLSKSGTWPLGDIFICFPFAKKRVKRENISIEDKLKRLAVHGLLHLLGYDHEKSRKEAKKMFSLENKILTKSLRAKD